VISTPPNPPLQARMNDYWKFLSSRAWRKIRKRILARDSGVCVICGSDAKEVHHHDYDKATMCGENDDSLVSLCEDCHRSIEFSTYGEKRTSLREKRVVFENRKIAYSALKKRGIDLVCSENVQKKQKIVTVSFKDKYWGEHFVEMSSVLWSLICSFRTRYNLHLSRRTSLKKLYRDRGIPLVELPSRKRRMLFRIIGEDTGQLSYIDGEYDMPWKEFLKREDYSFRVARPKRVRLTRRSTKRAQIAARAGEQHV
jgi:hypothetical protein